MAKPILCFLTFSILALGEDNSARAIQDRAQTAIAGMAKLTPLVGLWQGSGKAFFQNKQFTSNCSYLVTEALHGKVIFIEAQDTMSWVPPEAQGGLAAISYDASTKGYQVRFFFGDGRWVDATGAMEGQSFVWGYGLFRTKLKVEGNKFSSVSEVQVDNSWKVVSEETLIRK